ncbi:hypothetical protein CpecF_0560 [Chlamydia pecorum DBDeUG]|nr:hypothetical protein CpecF_0560 [Chlamydia pecorum DBDeUG]
MFRKHKVEFELYKLCLGSSWCLDIACRKSRVFLGSKLCELRWPFILYKCKALFVKDRSLRRRNTRAWPRCLSDVFQRCSLFPLRKNLLSS